MKEIVMLPEYISGIDQKEVQALRIRMIDLDPMSGRMVLKFFDKRFPPMISNAKIVGLPAPGDWIVKHENNTIEFKNDLEFRSEYRIIN